jgi:ATP-dependent DNA helicase PIF1
MRLKYIRLNQNQLRVDLYSGLLDYVHNQANENHAQAGRMFVLPSSFSGSPRNMQQRFQNAIALVSKFGRPDLFLTFTCNPKWTKIQFILLPNQVASDRPDIVSRVFNLKANAFVKEIVEGMLFGCVISYTYSIKFQKRGLPHMHLLVILSGEDKVYSDPDKIDNVVSAEIPKSVQHPRLHDLVREHMIHGPCGSLNPLSPCMKEDGDGTSTCSKFFPKNFCANTNAALSSNPLYCRRYESPKALIGLNQLGCEWVVPYNPYLLQCFNTHINVEICANIQVIKYVYKYFF